MKRSRFPTIFFATVLMTFIFGAISFTAFQRAFHKDPSLKKTILQQLENSGNFVIQWNEGGGSWENQEESWNFNANFAEVHLKLTDGNVSLGDSPNNQIQIKAEGQHLRGAPRHLLLTEPAEKILTISDSEGHQVISKEVNVRILIPQNFHGKIFVNTASGTVEVTSQSQAALQAQSVSGDFRIANAGFESLDLNTVSGEVNLESQKPAKIHIKTVSGDVHLQLMDPEKSEFHLSSLSGEIRNPFHSSGKNDNPVAVETASGDIEVLSAQ